MKIEAILGEFLFQLIGLLFGFDFPWKQKSSRYGDVEKVRRRRDMGKSLDSGLWEFTPIFW